MSLARNGIHPTNPEAALTPPRKDGRPSLAWVEWTIKELNNFSTDDSNATKALVYVCGLKLGYTIKQVCLYLGYENGRSKTIKEIVRKLTAFIDSYESKYTIAIITDEES